MLSTKPKNSFRLAHLPLSARVFLRLMESLDSYGRERDDTLYAMNVQFSYMSLMHRVPSP